MGIVRNVIMDANGLQRQQLIGDTLAIMEVMPAANSGTAVTITGNLLAAQLLLSSAASAPTFTFDSAANIVASLAPSYGYNPNASLPAGTTVTSAIQNGTSFLYKIIMSTANAATVTSTANTGVTVNRGSVAASSSRDFLITINNGTPAQTFSVGSTNASANITVTPAQAALLSVGMIVTNAALGLQAQTITAVNITTGVVTMSGNANATATATSLTFSPVITVDGL